MNFPKWLLLCTLALPVFAQPAPAPQNALLRYPADEALIARSLELMESTGLAMPDLYRASLPLTEGAKQALTNLRAGPATQHLGYTYTCLQNLRAYLALADSLPKPYPMNEAAAKQLAELRDAASRIEAHFGELLLFKESRLRNGDRDQLQRYSDANDKVGPPNAAKPRVVFLGDSITDGWPLNEYFTGRDFVNRGISGQITSQMLARMKADVIDLKPRAMIVLAGTNDLGLGVSLKTIQNNLTMIADLAKAFQIRVIFSSVLPVNDYGKAKNPRFEHTRLRPPDQILALNRWMQDFCKKRELTYADYFTPMVDGAGRLKQDLSDDGLHPNAAGYRIMAPVALETINKVIGAAK